jgi:tetratricopeptide (TPR) repeat protein
VPRGQVVSQVVATRRLGSTLLRLLGLGEPAKGFGAPLPGLAVSEDNAAQPIYSESWMPASAYGWAPLRAISDQRWRWIEAPRPELYDFVADPSESKNLWAERSEVVAQMEQSLSRLESSIQSREASAPQLDPELAAALRSLGYFSGASTPPGAATGGKTDPKDGIGMLQELESSKRALEGGNTEQALQGLELLVRRSPGNVPFLTQLARAQLAAGQTGKAIATDREAIARNPNLDFLHLQLAGAYRAGGQAAEARQAYQRALQLNPRLAAAWLGLAEMAFEQGRKEEERRLLQQAVEAGTDSAALLSRLAQLEIAESDYQAADLHLQRATSLNPLWAAAWLVWGDLGEKQNRPQEALERYLKAIAADPTDGASLLRASRLLLKLERKDQARSLLQQAATGAADPTAREQARLKLAQLDRDSSKP